MSGFVILLGIVALLLLLVLRPGVAADSIEDMSLVYPPGYVTHAKDVDKRILLCLGSFDVVASKTKDFKVSKLYLPFDATVLAVYATAQEVVVATAITLNVEVAGGTPQIVTDVALAAVTAGAGSNQSLTLAAVGTAIAAGQVVEVSYGSGAGDSATNVMVYAWLKPRYTV